MALAALRPSPAEARRVMSVILIKDAGWLLAQKQPSEAGTATLQEVGSLIRCGRSGTLGTCFNEYSVCH